uniref:Uncharacterized protein n=1 Tax=Lepeophtheirus salmonis TaxID=72036 RepID=A0A0K2UBR0_LEPSM
MVDAEVQRGSSRSAIQCCNSYMLWRLNDLNPLPQKICFGDGLKRNKVFSFGLSSSDYASYIGCLHKVLNGVGIHEEWVLDYFYLCRGVEGLLLRMLLGKPLLLGLLLGLLLMHLNVDVEVMVLKGCFLTECLGAEEARESTDFGVNVFQMCLKVSGLSKDLGTNVAFVGGDTQVNGVHVELEIPFGREGSATGRAGVDLGVTTLLTLLF